MLLFRVSCNKYAKDFFYKKLKNLPFQVKCTSKPYWTRDCSGIDKEKFYRQ